MADKPDFVDVISEATRQNYRRVMPRVIKKKVAKDESRLSHWPPEHLLQWRMENLMPWKIKRWQLKDWI
jgi:hypothetical protein